MTTYTDPDQAITWRPGMVRYGVRLTSSKAWRVFDFATAQWMGNASEDRGTAAASARKLNKETHAD